MGLPALIVAAILYEFHPLLAVPFLGIFFVEVVQEDACSAQLLRRPTMRFLGIISYSAYLIHPFIMNLLRSTAVKVAHANIFVGEGILIVCGPIAAILVAWISYESIERQLTKIILKKI